jgi:hypothetical protein
MSHDYLWDVLSAIGMPCAHVDALKLFYKNNKHFIKVGEKAYPSVEVHSGVRQGCPLSPILFALCANVLLRELSHVLSNDEIVRAFADDTAVVIADFVVSMPVLGRLFKQFEQISALSLNISKTIFVPLWNVSSPSYLKTYLRELCPLWRDISVKPCGKYLGYFVGPGAGEESWAKPLEKFLRRAEQWASMSLGLFYNTRVYSVFIATVLSFIMLLSDDPPELETYFHKTIRKLAPGPGNWITLADATHLECAYSFPCSFQNPTWTSMAAKLRVISTLAQDCYQKRKDLENAQIELGRRPFPEWHRKCFFCILARCGEYLKSHGITVRQVESTRAQTGKNVSFQRTAETLIRKRLEKVYYPEARIRQKLVPWKVTGVPAYLERRVLSNLALLKEWCPPRVMAVYLRSIWGGWVTDERMSNLLRAQGAAVRPCVLNCGWEEDSLYHYGRCSVYWEFLSQPLGAGLGIALQCRSGNAFLLLNDMGPEDKIRLALGMYALYWTVQYLRHHSNTSAQPITLMKTFLNKAHQESKSSALLRATPPAASRRARSSPALVRSSSVSSSSKRT